MSEYVFKSGGHIFASTKRGCIYLNNHIYNLEKQLDETHWLLDSLVNFDHYSTGEAISGFIQKIHQWQRHNENTSNSFLEWRLARRDLENSPQWLKMNDLPEHWSSRQLAEKDKQIEALNDCIELQKSGLKRKDKEIEELKNENQEIQRFLNIEIGGHQSTMDYVKELKQQNKGIFFLTDANRKLNKQNQKLIEFALSCIDIIEYYSIGEDKAQDFLDENEKQVTELKKN